jgi:glutamate/tyrosine decarboxylase-like PLP-dependent enzyme
MELSREFRGLKVWMLLKEHGIAKYSRLIEQNVEQAKYLAGLVHRHSELELLAPVPLNVVCLRYCKAARDRLDDLNREVLMRIQEQGIAVPSATVLHGKFGIRVAITNHRTTKADLDLFAERLVAIGREVTHDGFGGTF